jgi:nitrogen regulatory protein P-II 1
MKMIHAIVRPERFDFVKKALEDMGCFGMTVSEVMGRGSQKGIALPKRRGTVAIEFLPKVKIELVVKDKDLDAVVTTIERAAKTGKFGDGRIFVMPIERSIRVRTGEEEHEER